MADDITLWEAVLLGIVQGLTEWLPVSSSGHLVLVQELVGADVPVAYDLLLHLGTLAVVLFYYRATLVEIARATLRLPSEARGDGGWRAAMLQDPHRRLGLLVVVGTVPAAAVGLAFGDAILATFHDVRLVGFALLFTGTLLWATRSAWKTARPVDLTWRRSLFIGAFQALALFPGVSRSGSTISAAALAGLDREKAVQYSFLLSVPAIVGAVAIQAPGELLVLVTGASLPHFAGLLAAIVVGYAALALLVRIARNGGLHVFAFYCWGAGAFALWLAWGGAGG